MRKQANDFEIEDTPIRVGDFVMSLGVLPARCVYSDEKYVVADFSNGFRRQFYKGIFLKYKNQKMAKKLFILLGGKIND